MDSAWYKNMPSDAAKKRAAKKKAAASQRGKSAGKKENGDAAEGGASVNGIDSGVSAATQALAEAALSDRSCTGVLGSHAASRDLHIDAFCLASHGMELFVDTKIELNSGRRYGLLGLNGCGKLPLEGCQVRYFLEVVNGHDDAQYLSACGEESAS